MNLSSTASLCVYTEPSTTGPQSELNTTVISAIIEGSCCWVQAVCLSSLGGRLGTQCCPCLHPSCSPPKQPSQKAWENVQCELHTRHGCGLEPVLNQFIRALQDFSTAGGHHHTLSPEVFLHSRHQQTMCFWMQGSYPWITNRILLTAAKEPRLLEVGLSIQFLND